MVAYLLYFVPLVVKYELFRTAFVLLIIRTLCEKLEWHVIQDTEDFCVLTPFQERAKHKEADETNSKID
jgi:hypothetical protein